MSALIAHSKAAMIIAGEFEIEAEDALAKRLPDALLLARFAKVYITASRKMLELATSEASNEPRQGRV